MAILIRTHEIVGDPHHHPIKAFAFQFGAHHNYSITLPHDTVNLQFQQGPVQRVGENGLDDLDLLAVLDNRMQGFAALPDADRNTVAAAAHIRAALRALKRRKVLRMTEGSEGK